MTDEAMLSFPMKEEEFANDDRISFSRVSNTHIAVDDDGSEYEWNPDQKRWILHEEEYDDEVYPGETLGDYGAGPEYDAQSKKRKSGPTDEAEDNSNTQGNKKKQRPSKKPKPPPAPRQNTAVYVTGVPLDATEEEIYQLFSKKGGVIAEEIDSGRPRIKMYTDEAGKFKGDALVVFFKPQSVEMAIMLLDDTDFRYTSSGLTSGRIRVQAADSSYKKTNYDQEGKPTSGGGGGKDNGKPPAHKSDKERQKIIAKTQKLSARLADWDDDDPSALSGPQQDAPRKSKTVILKHMFTLQELDEDPAALLDIKEDIREECEKLGEVTNVVLYDLEAEGVVSVKFRTVEAAEACVDLMDGRSFDGRIVEARLSQGKERYKQSAKKNDHDDDD